MTILYGVLKAAIASVAVLTSAQVAVNIAVEQEEVGGDSIVVVALGGILAAVVLFGP